MAIDIYIKIFLLLSAFIISAKSYDNDGNNQNDEGVWDVQMEDSYRCEPLNVQFCQHVHVGYNETIMPNLLNHQNQQDAGQAFNAYLPALKVDCSRDIYVFLCSVFFPVCTMLKHPIPPCKSLCLSVKNGCEHIIKKFSREWPEQLSCDRFPEDGTEIVCLNPNSSDSTSSSNNGDRSGGKKVATKNTLSSTLSPPLSGNVYKDFGFTCPDHFKVSKGYDDSLKVGNAVAKNCGIPCDGMFFTPEEVKFSRVWIGIWSLICAVSCLFTVLTFLINTSRFRYPERPVIFLSVCYLVISVVYILGFVSGERVACRRPFTPPIDKPKLQTVSTVSQGTKGELCTIMFIALYYFSMASSLWWVILALTWFLAAGLKWGHEAIEANSQYFHLIAWAIPAVKTITILAIGKIEGDVLTGVCYVGLWNTDMLKGFVLAPLTVYLVLGSIFLILGFVSLFRIRTAMKHDGTKTDKLEKLMLRIGVFSVLYLVPALTVIICLFYEQLNFDHWMVTWHRQICQKSANNSYLIRCPQDGGAFDNRRPSFYIFMLKYLSSLIVGISSSVWMWSGKTVSSWKELFYRLKGKKLHTYV